MRNAQKTPLRDNPLEELLRFVVEIKNSYKRYQMDISDGNQMDQILYNSFGFKKMLIDKRRTDRGCLRLPKEDA